MNKLVKFDSCKFPSVIPIITYNREIYFSVLYLDISCRQKHIFMIKIISNHNVAIDSKKLTYLVPSKYMNNIRKFFSQRYKIIFSGSLKLRSFQILSYSIQLHQLWVPDTPTFQSL